MSNQSLDFKAIKVRVSFQDALSFLGVDSPSFNEEKQEYRLPCPACNAGSDRAVSISIEKQSFICHAKNVEKKPSGDVIALVAHFKDIGMYQSAKLLDENFLERVSHGAGSGTEPTVKKESKGFDPEQYAQSLDNSAEALKPFGLSPELVENIGWMGVCKKGINAGKLVFPLRGEFGEFIDFIGVDSATVPKKWRVA